MNLTSSFSASAAFPNLLAQWLAVNFQARMFTAGLQQGCESCQRYLESCIECTERGVLFINIGRNRASSDEEF